MLVILRDLDKWTISRALCTLHCLTTKISSIVEVSVVPLAEMVSTEVGLECLVVDAELDWRFHAYQCRPRLQCNLENTVHVLVSLSEVEQLRSDLCAIPDNRHILSWPAR